MSPPSGPEVKILVLTALLALLVVSYFFERSASQRNRENLTFLFGIVALLAVYSYFNCGLFRSTGPQKFVHIHEQFHQYLGAEYLEEIRYDGIYLATALAGREDRDWDRDPRLRDPMNFRLISAGRHWEDAQQVKKRFSIERWNAFKADRRVLFRELHLAPAALIDHGNTGSPAWAMLAVPFTRSFGMSPAAATVYFFLDQGLLLGLFFAMWRCFGVRAACIAITLGLMPLKVFDFLGGSLFRLDWLFALGMSACCLKVRRYKASGLFLGFAIASKLFCGLVALALGIGFVIETVRTRRLRGEQVQLVASAVAALIASVVISAIYFGGFEIWGDYWQRILVTFNQKYYSINHSFRDLFLQATHSGSSVLDWLPEQIAASLPLVTIHDYTLSFLLVRLAIVAGLICVLARHEMVFAYGVGVLMIFVLLVTNMYYWQMLLLPALACASNYRGDPRKFLYLAFLCVFLIAEHVIEGIGELERWHGYFGSYWLGMFCGFVFLVELLGAARLRRLFERGLARSLQLFSRPASSEF